MKNTNEHNFFNFMGGLDKGLYVFYPFTFLALQSISFLNSLKFDE